MIRNSNTPNASTGNTQSQLQAQPAFRPMEFVFACLRHWKWFILSLALTLGVAYLYLQHTPKVYTRTASIMIKSESNRSGSENQLLDLGLIQSYSDNVTNELLSLKTVTVAAEIVDRLDLEVEYWREGTFRKELLYGLTLPVKAELPDLNDHESVSLQLDLQADSTAVISQMVRNGQPIDGQVTIRLGETLQSPLGTITLTASPYYDTAQKGRIEVTRSNVRNVASSVMAGIQAGLRSQNASIIDLTYRDISIGRAEDILNTLITVYNENWIKDRNQMAISTSSFIKERLGVIEQELGNVEEDITSYKSQNLMTDVSQVSQQAMEQITTAEQESNLLSNQLYMIRYIRSHLTDESRRTQLLPSGSGVNPVIERQVQEYNTVVLQRNKHLASSSAHNPLVMDLEQELGILRNALLQSLDTEVALLNTHQRNVQATRGQAVSRMTAAPTKAQYLLSVERQQKVKESLYLFLLQKREENELSQAFTAYNNRLIEPPYGSMSPSSPVDKDIYSLALIIGLAVPAGLLFLLEFLNGTVRGRKDLEHLPLPFVGEIPEAIRKKKGLFRRKEAPQPYVPVVKEHNRNIINEAFRVVRSNLEFVLGYESTHRVIMITSINPGSGKTFITANLATALALKNKKVLAIDLDLRKATLSHYVGKPKQGISDYLSGKIADYHSVMVQLGSVDILPCGTLPPNPAELLSVPRFKQLMAEVREQYDYVFIDCPPAEVVADATIINRYADLTLFIVRAEVMARSFLPELARWYDEKKFNNLCMMLNGTTELHGRYGYHKYGYYGSYGYGYGYGYGYKYGNDKDDE